VIFVQSLTAMQLPLQRLKKFIKRSEDE